MKGAFEKLKNYWPTNIEHNEKDDPDKKLRYQVGRERLAFLKMNVQNFAYKDEKDHQVVAYLTELHEEDLDYRMPETTRFEYLAGRIQGTDVIIFSYIWFDTLADARVYATSKRMSIEGGWHEKV